MSSRHRLRGKVAVVTGGGGVICSAISMALAKRGAAVAVLDLKEEVATKVCAAINGRGWRAISIKADVTSRDSIEAASEQISRQLGPPDILINGAGGNLGKATTSAERPFFSIPTEALQAVVNLNFLGTFICCQVFGKSMAQSGFGDIVNISSMNAFRPLTNIPAYSAAKAAVTNFTQWLAVHMAQNYSPGIRVNAVAPGFLLTEQNRYLLVDEKGELTARGRSIIEHTPMKRLGEPEDVVGPVLWILTDEARFITGVILPVDGGFSAFGGV